MRELPLVILFAVFSTFGSGCAIGLGKSMHQYALSEFTEPVSGQSHSVEVEDVQTVILGFSFDTDFADSAYRKLLASCPNGRITQIQARHSTDLGVLAYKNKMRISGTCIQS